MKRKLEVVSDEITGIRVDELNNSNMKFINDVNEKNIKIISDLTNQIEEHKRVQLKLTDEYNINLNKRDEVILALTNLKKSLVNEVVSKEEELALIKKVSVKATAPFDDEVNNLKSQIKNVTDIMEKCITHQTDTNNNTFQPNIKGIFDSLEDAIASLESRLLDARINATIQDIQSNKENHSNDELNKFQQNVTLLEKKLEEAIHENISLKKLLAKDAGSLRTKSISELSKELQSLQSSNVTLNVSIKETAKNLEDERSNLRNMTLAYNIISQAYEDSEVTIRNLVSKLSQFENDILILNSDKQTLENKFAAFIASAGEKNPIEKIGELSLRCQQNEKDIETLESQLKSTRNQLDCERERREIDVREMAQLKAKYKNYNNSINEIESHQIAAQDSIDNNSNIDLLIRINEIDGKRHELSELNAMLELECKGYKEEIITLQNEVSSLNSKLNNLTSILKESTEVNVHKHNKILELEDKYRIVSERLASELKSTELLSGEIKLLQKFGDDYNTLESDYKLLENLKNNIETQWNELLEEQAELVAKNNALEKDNNEKTKKLDTRDVTYYTNAEMKHHYEQLQSNLREVSLLLESKEREIEDLKCSLAMASNVNGNINGNGNVYGIDNEVRKGSDKLTGKSNTIHDLHIPDVNDSVLNTKKLPVSAHDAEIDKQLKAYTEGKGFGYRMM